MVMELGGIYFFLTRCIAAIVATYVVVPLFANELNGHPILQTALWIIGISFCVGVVVAGYNDFIKKRSNRDDGKPSADKS